MFLFINKIKDRGSCERDGSIKKKASLELFPHLQWVSGQDVGLWAFRHHWGGGLLDLVILLAVLQLQ